MCKGTIADWEKERAMLAAQNIEEDNELSISFSLDAGDSFDIVITYLKGFTVEITPWVPPALRGTDHEKPFRAILTGFDPEASHYGSLRVKRCVDEEKDYYSATRETVRASRIKVL